MRHGSLEASLAAVHKASKAGNVEGEAELAVDQVDNGAADLVTAGVHEGDAVIAAEAEVEQLCGHGLHEHLLLHRVGEGGSHGGESGGCGALDTWDNGAILRHDSGDGLDGSGGATALDESSGGATKNTDTKDSGNEERVSGGSGRWGGGCHAGESSGLAHGVGRVVGLAARADAGGGLHGEGRLGRLEGRHGACKKRRGQARRK